MLEAGARNRTPEEPAEAEAAPAARSKTPVVPEGAPWNAVERLMFERRSIRRFRKTQVPAHMVRRLLEVARYAPSQGNCQPWKFVVVRDPAVLAAMEEFCVAACRRLSGLVDYAAMPGGSLRYRLARVTAKLLNRLRPNMLHPVPVAACAAIAEGRFAVFHRAPTVILLLVDKRGVGIPPVDIGICGTNIVLAAHSFGLGTCWVGFSKFLNDSAEWRAKLGAEAPFEITEAICVGYPVGDTTHLIARETHEILWMEDGRREVIY